MLQLIKNYLQSNAPALLMSGVHSSLITQVVISCDETPYLIPIFQNLAETHSVFATDKNYFISHARQSNHLDSLRLKRGKCLINYAGMYLYLDFALISANYRDERMPGVTVRFLTRDRKKFNDLIKEFTPESLMSNRLINVSDEHRSSTRTLGYIGQRFKAQEQFIDDRMYEELDMRINRVISDHAWYQDRNLPLKETCLLYGPPGTGKTSLIRHMAAKYRMDIYTVTPDNMSQINDGNENYRIILLEDVDAFRYLLKEEFQPREREEMDYDTDSRGRFRPQHHSRFNEQIEASLNRPHPRYSAFINALDGIVSLDRCIVFITTNYPERIIPSVLRKGRVDVKFHFDHPEIELVIKKMGWTARDKRSKFIKENYQKGDIVVGMLPELKFAKTIDEIKNIVNQINTFD